MHPAYLRKDRASPGDRLHAVGRIIAEESARLGQVIVKVVLQILGRHHIPVIDALVGIPGPVVPAHPSSIEFFNQSPRVVGRAAILFRSPGKLAADKRQARIQKLLKDIRCVVVAGTARPLPVAIMRQIGRCPETVHVD